MKGLYLLLPMLLLGITAGAQQLPLFTQYREYHSVINPGAVTSDFLLYEYTTSAGLSHRRQFAGIENGIQTQIGRFDYMSIPKKIMVSGFLLRDQTGPSGTTGIYGRMAYLFSYDPREWGLGVGLSGGLARFRIDVRQITWTHTGDPAAADDLKKVYPDVGAGAFFYKSMQGGWQGDRWYAGISTPQLFGLDLDAPDPQNNQYQLRRVTHFYSNLGMIKYVNENTFIEPSIWFKYVPNTPVNIDFNFRTQFGQLLLIGLGYSTADNLHLEAGLQIGELFSMDNQLLRLGYSFDRFFTQFGPTFGPTHEINLVFAYSQLKRRG